MNILMLLFTRKNEGTFYRAFPWAIELAAHGHLVTIVCTATHSPFRKVVSINRGVCIIEMPSLFTGRHVMARLSGMYGWGPLDIATRTRELRRGQFDIVHTFEHHMHVALPVFLAGRRATPVLVADWCDHYGKGGFREYTYSPYRLYPLYNLIGWPFRLVMDHLEGALRRRADVVTVISTFLRQRAIALGVPAERILLIPGSAETTLIHPQPAQPARKKLQLDENLRYALFFGAGQFDLDFSLEAFAQVLRQWPKARFIIIGEKTELVTQKATELGLQYHVVQTGWVDDAQLGDWLACADVCLLPMKDTPINHARWPNKIGFYMAAGRPIVATAVNDASTLIADRRIGMVSLPTTTDFADKILQLFQYPELAETLGARARHTAETEFATPIHASEIERLYRNMLEAAHG